MRPQAAKQPLDPARVRTIPPHFSWIDRRFVREGLIEALSREEIVLYFFLVAVADRHGLSFYGDPKTCVLLKLTCRELDEARRGLMAADLIAYRAPLYQVLAITTARAAAPSRGPQALGDLLRPKLTP